MDSDEWIESRQETPEKLAIARKVLEEIRSGVDVFTAARHYPLQGGGYIPKHTLVAAYHQLVERGEWQNDPALLSLIRMKPVRSLSGVTTVTVLTRPYPCPGHCIFCPDDSRMPKSYLIDEPGAMRGLQNAFDPYLQVSSRLTSYEIIGHPIDKIELLILGGTWSAYRRDYQEEFVLRCFEAMNAGSPPTPTQSSQNPPLPPLENSPTGARSARGVREERPALLPPFFQGGAGGDSALAAAHTRNETAAHRNVGIVIETRPDEITPAELAWLRQLGVTKVQMGAQSLDDGILALNQRGHSVADTRRACLLLRAAGFKIVLHWMPNLLGATPASDRADFARLWQEDPDGLGLCPDEIKIYPTQLLRDTELYRVWQRGDYRPYLTTELVDLLADIKPTIPEYCRVNRVIRDIPSPHVVEGNKRTSLRQDVLAELDRRGQHCRCVRCREIRQHIVSADTLELRDLVYHPAQAEEHFLSYVDPNDRLAGYLRLSLPDHPAGVDESSLPLPLFADLQGAALVREVHVYGQSLAVGAEQSGAAQHSGLGTQLLEQAATIARAAGFRKLAVIAAVGTRLYYEKRGFERGELYMVKNLVS
jgi:elongator complex protein 3